MIGLRARARRALERARDILNTLLDDARIAEEDGDLEPPRPRVGAWVETSPGYLAIIDDRGHEVGAAWDIGGEWRICARRPSQAPVFEGAPTKQAAQARVLDVLATWADVSAARVPVPVADCHAGATMSDPVSPAGEGR